MEPKIKYITFHTKQCMDLYGGRTCSPYKYPKCNKCTVPVRKVLCKYKKIITKNCRINDMLKFMDTDVLFPMNREEYTNLLVEVVENSTSFFNSLSMFNGNNIGLKILQLAYYPVQDNYQTIQTLLYNELDGSYSVDIKSQVKILKFNLMSCIRILKDRNNIPEDWMTTHIVVDLESYIGNLRTVCNFIYLIILKKKSTAVHKLLPTEFYGSSKIHICSFCGQIEVVCRCFADLASTSDKNYNEDGDYFSPEVNRSFDDQQNVAHCSKSTVHAEPEDADFWPRYLENYGYENNKSKRYSQESSTDTD